MFYLLEATGNVKMSRGICPAKARITAGTLALTWSVLSLVLAAFLGRTLRQDFDNCLRVSALIAGAWFLLDWTLLDWTLLN